MKAKIDKQTLAQMLVFYTEDRKRHHFLSMTAIENEKLTAEQNLENNIVFASNSAGVKIIRGKIKYGQKYLVSRGEKLGFSLKPAVVLEYSNHWPWDFCYMYKL